MRLTSVFAIICLIFAIQVSCQQEITLSTQIGETREIDLTQYFPLISSDFQAVSSTKSAFTLDKAFTQVSQAVQATYTAPISADQLALSSTSQQRVEFTPNTNGGFTISMYLITKSTSSFGITLQASNIIPATRATGIGKVTLIKPNFGFFTYNKNNIYQVAYFSLITSGQTPTLQVSVPGGSGLYLNLHPSYPLNVNPDNSIYFVNLQITNGKQINLLYLNANGDFSIVQSIDIPCDTSLFTPSIFQSGQSVYFLCQNNLYDESDFYSVIYSNQQMILIQSDQPLQGVGSIFDVQLYKGNIYIFHEKTTNQRQLYLTKIYAQGSNLVQSDNIAISGYNSAGSFLKVNVQNDKFIQIITATQLIGVNPQNGQVLTQFAAPAVSGFQLQNVIQVFEFSQLSYVSTTDATSFMQSKIKFLQPKLKFNQLNASAQQYTVSFTNKLILQQLIINSNQLTVDSTGLNAVTVLSNNEYSQLILENNPESVNLGFLNVENLVIGSNLQLTQNVTNLFGPFKFDSNLVSVNLLKQTIPDFAASSKNTNLKGKKLNNLKSVSENIVNIYSTQTNVILIESLTTDGQTQITLAQVLSTFDSSLASLITQDQLNVANPLTQVDNSGFFGYVGANSYYYIKLFVETSFGQYQFYDVTTSCQQADGVNFTFSADYANNIIVVFCQDQVSQITYYYDISKQILVATSSNVLQLNGLITYPIVQKQASLGLLTLLDTSNTIFTLNYLQGYTTQKILIPAQTSLTTLKTILYSSSFLLVLQDGDNNVTVKQYSYALGTDNKSANYLRQLNLASVQGFSVNQIKSLIQFKTNDLFYIEEYLLTLSGDMQTVTLFRLNKISAQNQLYQQFKLPSALSGLNFLYFAEDTIGFTNGKLEFTSYFLTEFITLYSSTTVTDFAMFETQLVGQGKNVLTISKDNTININYILQKDVSADNARISSNQLSQLTYSKVSSYFQNLDIANTQKYAVNLNGIVNSNLFGWEVTYKTGIPDGVIANVTELVSIDTSKSSVVYDQIELMNNFYAKSIGNSIYIGSDLYTQFENQYDNCNLYIDQSTVSTTTTETKQIQTSLTFNALCYSIQNQQVLMDTIQFEGLFDPANQKTTYQSTNYTYVGVFADMYAQRSLVISKIYSDTTLGSVMLVKSTQNYGFVNLCQYSTIKSNLTLTIDCTFNASSNQINALGIVDAVWIDAIKNYLYITGSGVIYLNLAGTLQSVNLLNIEAINEQLLCDQCNVISAGQSSNQNNFFIAFDDVQVLELNITASADESTPFTVASFNNFLGEQSLSFTGFGILQSPSNYLFLMQSRDDPSTFFATLYQQYNIFRPSYYIMQSSTLFTLNQKFFTNSFRLFTPNSNGQIGFLANTYATNSSSVQNLNFNMNNIISVQSISTNKTINGPGAYLQLLGTDFSNSTTIPLNVIVNSKSNKSHSSLLYTMISSIFIFVFLLY